MARVAQTTSPPDGAPEMAARFAYIALSGFARVFSILVLLAAWEWLARSGTFTHYQLPSLSSVLERIWGDAVSGELFINAGLTLYRALVSFAICTVGGVAIGMTMSRNKIANWFFDAIFSAIAATVIAIQGVERELIWSARNMGANQRELLTQIVLPAALPQIMTGLQVALPLTLIVAAVAEMLMGGYGLGGAMMDASRFANSPGVFAGIVEIAVVGYILVKAMSMLRRRLLIWHQEANEPTTA